MERALLTGFGKKKIKKRRLEEFSIFVALVSAEDVTH
jgi:hypothetical protein